MAAVTSIALAKNRREKENKIYNGTLFFSSVVRIITIIREKKNTDTKLLYRVVVLARLIFKNRIVVSVGKSLDYR